MFPCPGFTAIFTPVGCHSPAHKGIISPIGALAKKIIDNDIQIEFYVVRLIPVALEELDE
jgi:hypothetical protein